MRKNTIAWILYAFGVLNVTLAGYVAGTPQAPFIFLGTGLLVAAFIVSGRPE